MAELIAVDTENLCLDIRLTEEEAHRIANLAASEAASVLASADSIGSKLLEGAAPMQQVETLLESANMLRQMADLLFDTLDENFPEFGNEPPSYDDEGPHEDLLGPQEWTTLGTLEIDAATMGFADPRAHGLAQQGERLTWSGVAAEPGSVGPWPVVAMSTGGDQSVPIEVVHGDDGAVVAVRLELVNDIAFLGGRWTEAGTIDLPNGEVSVCDPYCGPSAWRTIDVRAGSWSFQVFESDHDGLLAARIVHPELASATGGDDGQAGDRSA